MDEEELWELAKKPVTEFVESIKNMNLNVDKLVRFYLKYGGDKSKTKLPNITQGSKTQPDNKSAGQGEHDRDKVLSPLACAKLELAIVFAINTCYWMYLVSHGEDPAKDDISKDIERVRLFMKRTKEVEESIYGSCSSAKRPKIDQEASKRLCMNNMTLKSNWT